MPGRLIVLTLLLAASGAAPVRAADPKGPPPSPAPPPGPLPLEAAAPVHDSFYLTGGCLLWPLAGSWSGVGWRDSDRSVLSVCREPLTGALQITEECILLKTDDYYCSLLNGGLGGIRSAWYLGEGCIAELDLGIPPCRSRGSIHWFPIWEVELMIGYDLLEGQWFCGWEVDLMLCLL